MKIGVKEEALSKKNSLNNTTSNTPVITTASNTINTSPPSSNTTPITGLVTPASRTRSVSRGSGGASPRGPHKPSSVAPAPPRPSSRPGSLNRFGFRAGGRAKGGDSTDSVNSILSDAQTASDSTPDLCDLCDLENGNIAPVANAHTQNTTSRLPVRPDNAGKLSPHSPKQAEQEVKQHQPQVKAQHSPPKQTTDPNHLDSPVSRLARPGTTSNSASAVPSPNPSGRLTATTWHLPKPQIPTVKSFPNSKIQPQPQVTQVYVDLPTRGKPFHPTPRVSRDSESSYKSTTEADSGLGSSSESDRIARGEEAEDTDTLDSSNLEFPEDVSELWLREKRGSILEAGRGGASHLAPHSTLEVAFRGSGSIEVKRRGLEVKVTANPAPSAMPAKGVGGGGAGSGVTASSPSSVLSSPPERKGKGGKEKREGPITYGMARQKFAPYSRNRFGYYHSSYQTRGAGNTDAAAAATTAAKLSIATSTTTTTTTTNKAHNGSPPTNGKLSATASPPKTSPQAAKTHHTTRTPPSQHHTSTKTSPPTSHTTTTTRSPPHHHVSPKTSPPHTTTGLVKSRVALLETPPHHTTRKPSPQPPPSLRKPALKKPLVRPTSLEKSPALVMPVSERNIELSKPVFRRLEYSVDSEGQKDNTMTQGREVVQDILIVGSVETETVHDNTGDLKLTSREKTIERSLKNSPNSDLPPSEVTKASQDAKEREKVLMETSMEASLTSMTSDLSLTPQNLSPDGSKILTPQSESSFEILESLSETLDLTIEEAKKVDDQDEPASTSSTASSTSFPSSVPAPHTTPTPAHRQTNAYPHTHALTPHTTTTTTSPTVDHHKPLSQLLSSLKSSMDSRSSLESSGDSQRSPTEAVIPGGHHHPPPALTNSSSGPSGTCTPVLTSVRDLDLDFLIDDEIADQPGLTFGDDAGGGGLSTSFFGDDEFDELVAAVSGGGGGGGSGVVGPVTSPTHLHHHHSLLLPHHHHGSPVSVGGGGGSGGGGSSAAAAAAAGVGEGCHRPRADSLDTTTSSLAGDDLMLDYEARYDEEVMSPDASEIFSEWTAMMAEMGGGERCASRDGSCGSSRVPRPRQGSLTEAVLPSDPRRPMVLRPPRQGSVSESEGSCGSGGSGSGGLSGSGSSGGVGGSGGGVFVDRTTYHYMYQDVTALKTMLLRLRRMLQAADTINPFDANLRNSLYLSLASSESPGLNGEKDALTPAQVCQENVDLRRQVVLLQQQLEDKDRTIRLLQQQLSQTLSLHHHHSLHNTSSSVTTTTTSTSPPAPYSSSTCTTSTSTATTAATINAATQTERLVRAPLTGSSLSRAASIDDGLGPTVSSEGETSERGRARSSATPPHHPHHPPRAASQPPPPPRPRPAPSHR